MGVKREIEKLQIKREWDRHVGDAAFEQRVRDGAGVFAEAVAAFAQSAGFTPAQRTAMAAILSATLAADAARAAGHEPTQDDDNRFCDALTITADVYFRLLLKHGRLPDPPKGRTRYD